MSWKHNHINQYFETTDAFFIEIMKTRWKQCDCYGALEEIEQKIEHLASVIRSGTVSENELEQMRRKIQRRNFLKGYCREKHKRECLKVFSFRFYFYELLNDPIGLLPSRIRWFIRECNEIKYALYNRKKRKLWKNSAFDRRLVSNSIGGRFRLWLKDKSHAKQNQRKRHQATRRTLSAVRFGRPLSGDG